MRSRPDWRSAPCETACAWPIRCSWPGHRELHALRRACLGLAADRQHLGQNAAGIARIDHAIVEYACAGREHIHLAVEHTCYLRLHRIELVLLDRLAASDRSGLRHDRHGLGGLFAAHHCGLGIRPREAESRMETAPAHAVI